MDIPSEAKEFLIPITLKIQEGDTGVIFED
jgi:hypothetical protein